MAIIEVQHLRKQYGDTLAVQDVDLAVKEGEIFGILGRNGAGKTTTVECLAGLTERDGGTVLIDGHDPAVDPGPVRQIVGVQLQDAALPPKLRAGEAVDLFASFYDAPADPRAVLAALGLGAKADTAFQALSGGQRQRLSIALALVGRPRIAILDELTTGLDPTARRETWALIEQIRDMGVTVVLVTHLMEEAERLCDRVAVIDRGRVVALDRPGALISGATKAQVLRFRPSRPVGDELLTRLPSVTGVRRTGDAVEVTGTASVLGEVVAALEHAGAQPLDLVVERATLEDAFVALTDDRSPASEAILVPAD